MATARIIEIKEEFVQLKFTMNEAMVLRKVLNQVGGHYEKSPRGLMDGLNKALSCAGIKMPDLSVSYSSGVYFDSVHCESPFYPANNT